jgi:RsiW-degrading membrane proteinase PrsW (M82 family)
MDAALVLAYFLPIGFLALFIGSIGRKFVLYLLWGFVASIPVIILVPHLVSLFPEIVGSEVTISPVLEEFFKALPIVIPAVLGSRNSNRDLLVYAMASGIGFSIMENWVMFGGVIMSFFSVLVRSFSTSLMHGCTCGIVGYGIVLTRDFHRKALPVLLLGFFMVAVLIHAVYNLDALYLGVAGIIIDLLLPVLLFLILTICYHVDIPLFFTPARSAGNE